MLSESILALAPRSFTFKKEKTQVIGDDNFEMAGLGEIGRQLFESEGSPRLGIGK